MKRLATVWLALGIALTACTAQQQSSASQNAQQLASSAPDAAKNAYLAAAVAAKLATVDVNSTTSVQTSANAGVVTLKGEAHDAAARQAYVAAAKSVSGVTSVRDMLVINPKLQGLREQTDDVTLQARVAAAIAAQTGINVFHINTVAHKGTVTLDGSVPSRAIESTVLEAAHGVIGVRSIVNHLIITR